MFGNTSLSLPQRAVTPIPSAAPSPNAEVKHIPFRVFTTLEPIFTPQKRYLNGSVNVAFYDDQEHALSSRKMIKFDHPDGTECMADITIIELQDCRKGLLCLARCESWVPIDHRQNLQIGSWHHDVSVEIFPYRRIS